LATAITSTERRTTWTELFFDLSFVAAIAVIVHDFSGQLNRAGLIEFIVFFLGLISVWATHAFYVNRFDEDGPGHRIVVFLQMMCVAVMAVYAHHGFDDGLVGFVVAFIFSRLLFIGLYSHVKHHHPEAAPLAWRFLVGFSASVVAWTIVAFYPVAWVVIIIALVIDYSVPLITMPLLKRFPFDESHLPERIGLFSIILLGEIVAGVVRAGSKVELTPEVKVVGLCGLLLAFLLWWLYFENVEGSVLRKGVIVSQVWLYSHIPFAMAILFVGVSTELAITHANQTTLAPIEVLLMCGAITVALCALALFEFLSRYTKENTRSNEIKTVVRILAACTTLSIGVLTLISNPLALLGGVVLLLLVVVIIDSVIKWRFEK
jgi:low temperature requirement protein LtrA